MTFCSRRRHSVQPHWQHGWGIRDPIFFPPISSPWPFPWPSWGGIDGEWKMSATDLIFTPIGCQRSELCSNLCSGDRFWPFYNFQFLVVANLFFRWSYLYGHDGKLNSKFFFTDLGALALSRALVGIGERALENECHRFDFHTDWSPTERAMFDSLFRGPILAVLHFPVFWWSRIYFSVGGLQLPLWATGQTGGCHMFVFVVFLFFVLAHLVFSGGVVVTSVGHRTNGRLPYGI